MQICGQGCIPLFGARQMFGTDDWAVVAADGRFDGSDGGQEALVWRMISEVVKADQIRGSTFNAGLLQDLLQIQN